MIKESYIKGKVLSIMGKLGRRDQSKRLESDRAAARVANLCSQELDRSVEALKAVNIQDQNMRIEEFKRYMAKFIHHTIKQELK